jgi:kinesin light chain
MLYKQVLTQAHEREFGPIDDADSKDKAAWFAGDPPADLDKEGTPYGEYGGWYKACKVDSPTVTTTLKNLCALYRRQGKNDAADSLEQCALRFRKKALDVVKSSKVADMLGPEAVANNDGPAADSGAGGGSVGSATSEDDKKKKPKSMFRRAMGSLTKETK